VPALGDIAEPARIIVGRRKTAAEAATSAQEQSADFAKQFIRAVAISFKYESDR
jgi:hypothetical protein